MKKHGEKGPQPVSDKKKRRILGTYSCYPPGLLPYHPQWPLRGIQQSPIQKRGIVVILEVIPLLTQHGAVRRLIVGGDADGVRRVVEVNHMDVKHQHGRTRDIP